MPPYFRLPRLTGEYYYTGQYPFCQQLFQIFRRNIFTEKISSIPVFSAKMGILYPVM